MYYRKHHCMHCKELCLELLTLIVIPRYILPAIGSPRLLGGETSDGKLAAVGLLVESEFARLFV